MGGNWMRRRCASGIETRVRRVSQRRWRTNQSLPGSARQSDMPRAIRPEHAKPGAELPSACPTYAPDHGCRRHHLHWEPLRVRQTRSTRRHLAIATLHKYVYAELEKGAEP